MQNPSEPTGPRAEPGLAARRAASMAFSAARRVGEGLLALWRLARPVLRWTVQVVLALLILLEEWGWQPLSELAGRLARWHPWAQLETAIARLPPYAALAVFALPTL